MKGGQRHAVRLRWAKQGKVRWIGHRDVARAFERAFRIEALPLAFTEGFNPHPRVSFGLALSVGYESDVEYLDVAMTESVDLAGLPARLSPALPDGIDVLEAVPLVERAPSLQESVTCVGWQVAGVMPGADSGVGESQVAIARRTFDAVLAAATLPVMRRRKGREVVDDIRPAIRAVSVRGSSAPDPDGEVVVEIACATRPCSPKPLDIFEAGAAVTGSAPLEARRVRRTVQIIERAGERFDPLDADRAPHEPEVRAS